MLEKAIQDYGLLEGSTRISADESVQTQSHPSATFSKVVSIKICTKALKTLLQQCLVIYKIPSFNVKNKTTGNGYLQSFVT